MFCFRDGNFVSGTPLCPRLTNPSPLPDVWRPEVFTTPDMETTPLPGFTCGHPPTPSSDTLPSRFTLSSPKMPSSMVYGWGRGCSVTLTYGGEVSKTKKPNEDSE